MQNLSHPNSPSNSSSNLNPFIKIPNHILSYSLSQNKFILPLYIYSAINSSPFNNNSVSTNLSLITDTFFPGYSSPTITSAILQFKQALKFLSSEHPSLNYQSLELINLSMQSFSSFTKTTHLQYIFLDRNIKTDNHWTKFTYKEYFYIINSISLLSASSSAKQKINSIELLNLYLYLKSKIQFAQYTISKTNAAKYNIPLTSSYKNSISFSAPLESISKDTSLSRNTLTKYLHYLSDLEMISIKQGIFKIQNSSKSSNQYNLSNLWTSKI